MLGPDVLVVTSEFDRWGSREGRENDRLDVLGLDADGRIVVAELKRDAAPDSVALQSIKYTAMASRFDTDTLASAYLDFHREDNDGPGTVDEATAVLTAHSSSISTESLRSPRIVLIAGNFPPTLMSSIVWLSEQGLDFTLVQVQAYKLVEQHIVTVSQVWPVPDAEEFVVAPLRGDRVVKPTQGAPEVDWTDEELQTLATSALSPTILTTMDLCAQQPGSWVGGDQIMNVTGREKRVHGGDFGGFSITLRRRFGRSNAPYGVSYAAGGLDQQYYRVTPEIADTWRQLRGIVLDAQ